MQRDPSQNVYEHGYSPIDIGVATSIGAAVFPCLIGLSL
jgi:hypothetical protein